MPSTCDNGGMIEIAEISTLGACRIESPLSTRAHAEGEEPRYVSDSSRVLFDDMQDAMQSSIATGLPLPGFELAGARERIYFDPTKLRVGIVTCGGLCPGLNNVIAGLVQELKALYGVKHITGFRNGYQGFIADYGHDTVDLGSIDVQPMRGQGGTVLGSSRGNQDPVKIVDCLEREGIGVLFVIGGDGTMRGAQAIADEVRGRNLKIAVVCVPKTIDNDIPFIDQSFGFQTAFAEAAHAIRAGYVEATAAPNGISLIKLMGRYSGFIASYAALADTSADVVLIPEVPFAIEGDNGLLRYLEACLERRGHAVVVIAEGSGQEHAIADEVSDASGNKALGDIGGLLRKRVKAHFDGLGKEITLRYIDPSYAIRTVAANAYDSVYCIQLAQAAVHAAMAGKTEVVVGRFRRRFVHLPIPLLVSRTSNVDPDGDLWWSVLENTGQPYVFD
jgi:6-phosphofructokinase 1